jgi:hypothetical protein
MRDVHNEISMTDASWTRRAYPRRMRRGGAQTVRPAGQAGLTTALLSEWTDPDTALEVVGNTLDRFHDEPSAVHALRADARLRDSLHAVLLRMVDQEVLETRALADGRCAFRWSARLGAVSPEEANALVAAGAEAPPEAAPASAGAAGFWARMAVQTAPLLLPSVSCVLALLAFLWLDSALALAVTVLLAIVGVVGIVRRVQLATFWMLGLVIAGLLVRFS